MAHPTKLFQDQGYEQDPRAAAVDAYTCSHLLAPSRNAFHDALTHAYNHSLASGLPDISCSPTQGKFLAIQVRIAGATNVLEVGTLGGYSGIWFASAGPDVKVTSIEVDPKHKKIAEENFVHAGVSDQVQVLLGPGLEVLPRLVEEVKAGKREKFDFVFIDADKENNLNYFNLALEMVKPATCLYVDNIVRKGKLVDEQAIREGQKGVIGARQLIEAVGQDDRVEGVVLQTVSEKNYDGFLMAVAK